MIYVYLVSGFLLVAHGVGVGLVMRGRTWLGACLVVGAYGALGVNTAVLP